MITIGVPTVQLAAVALPETGVRDIYGGKRGAQRPSAPPVIPDIPPVVTLRNVLLQDGEALLLQDGTELLLEA